MKLIPAGVGVEQGIDNLLFNCTRNKACQREYFMPIPGFDIIQFYVDLAGPIDTYSISLVSLCDDATASAISNTNVVGQKPDLSYYGVFGDIVVTGDAPKYFYFRFVVTVSGADYFFYSNVFTTEDCREATLLRACYPNEDIGADASDCNGVYYGFTNGDFQGTSNYRYFHWAYVRDVELNEQKNKITLTLFNNRKPYKNNFTRETLFTCELVPPFYKDVLVGIMNRGIVRIEINGLTQDWTLAEENEVDQTDNDSKLWKVDITLGSTCLQYFGCGQADCELPEPPPEECCSPTDVSGEIQSDTGLVQCCSPDIDSTSIVTDGTESCCDPTDVTAIATILGDFTLEETILVEGTHTTSIVLLTPTPSQTGYVDWGDGTVVPFDTGLTGFLTIHHTYTVAGAYTYRFYFDVNSDLIYTSNYSNKALLVFTHSDNFTGLSAILLNGVIDIASVLPPPLSNISGVVLFGSVLSGNVSFDFSVLNAGIAAIQILDFPSLDTVTNLPATLTQQFAFTSNPVLHNIDSGSGGLPAAVSQQIGGNQDGSFYGPLDLSNCTQASFKQDYSSGQVDSILIDLDANGLSGGTCDVRQIPTATPGAGGLTAKANLISKGWTVNTD